MEAPRWNVQDSLQHLSPDEIRAYYIDHASPVAVGCLNLSGDINIGMMIRTSALFGVGHFYILGKKQFDRRSSVGSHHHMPLERVYAMKGRDNEYLDTDTARATLIELQQKFTLVFIEQSERSIKLRDIHEIKTEHPPMFIFGSESEGIPQCLLDLSDTYCVEIKQPGVGRSFNVSTACGMVLYEWFR